MSQATANGDGLREPFLAREGGAPEGCPEVEAIWRAVHGELPSREVREFVDHTAACPACAAAWRLAGDEGRVEAGAEAPAPFRASWTASWRVWIPAAAAALLAVAVLVAYRAPWRGPGIPAYRAQKTAAVDSLLEDGAAISREAFVLRWSPGPDGSRYRIRVTDEDLRPLVAAPPLLDRAEYAVSPEALRRVPAGGKILWQVVVVGPGGREAASETFTNRVE